MIFAFMLPSNFPFWWAAVGTFMAIVVFKQLTKDDFAHIAALMIDEMKESLAEKDITVSYDDAALVEGQKKMGKNALLQRFKGLGEMNPEQLWETTMNPAKRTLTRVQIDDAAMADKRITILMGDDSSIRKDYIYQYADFNKVDDFKITKAED